MRSNEEIVIKLVKSSNEGFFELGGSTPSSTKDMIFIVAITRLNYFRHQRV